MNAYVKTMSDDCGYEMHRFTKWCGTRFLFALISDFYALLDEESNKHEFFIAL